ncbi:unnamed protein product [Ascophyllum nodosum]
MGDVADILGFSGASTASGRASPALGGPLGPLQENKRTKGASSAVASSKKGKPQGVSREVYALLGSEGLPPEGPVSKPSLVKDKKDSKAPCTKWKWVSFTSSARSDGATFEHWQKADAESGDYAYARYNVKVDIDNHLRYSDEEYKLHLTDAAWTKLETDHLIQLSLKYDLRWPVIKDRYKCTPDRPVQELQKRFYDVANKLQGVRRPAPNGAGGWSLLTMPGLSAFNATHEAERRQQLEVQFNKTRENEEEEGKLREELKSIDQQIKKLKQSSKSSSKQGDEIQALADARRAIGYAPTPGQPYLLSYRLSEKSQTPSQHISKGLLKKVSALMKELAVPDKTKCMASKAAVDLHDHLKRDMMTLFSLEKVLQKKEADVAMARQSPEFAAAGGAGYSSSAAGVPSLARSSSGTGRQPMPGGGQGGHVRPGLSAGVHGHPVAQKRKSETAPQGKRPRR